MRLTTVTLALVTTAAFAGCATNPRVEGAGPAAPPPLRVWIGLPVASGRAYPILVNREAYVAMFEIVPGRGVTMVYPHGRAAVFAADMHYADLAMQFGRAFYLSDPFGFANFQPRYYYAIASVAPLNLARLQSSLGATRRILGRMYASYRPYDVIDRLTELVVPMQTDEDWATDLFVDWPVPPAPRSVVAYRLVRCANGRVIEVPANYPYYGCPGDTQLAVVAPPANPPIKELPSDSVRRPRMPGDSLRRPRMPRDRQRPTELSRSDDRQQPTELSGPDVEKRRRAEPGVRPPRVSDVARWPTETPIRHSGDRATASSSGQTSRAPATEPASSSGSSTKNQTVERREPRAQPAPERGESGKERKPQ